MTTTAAQRKAAERARHKEAGRVAVTVYIYPKCRPRLAKFIRLLNERAERAHWKADHFPGIREKV